MNADRKRQLRLSGAVDRPIGHAVGVGISRPQHIAVGVMTKRCDRVAVCAHPRIHARGVAAIYASMGAVVVVRERFTGRSPGVRVLVFDHEAARLVDYPQVNVNRVLCPRSHFVAVDVDIAGIGHLRDVAVVTVDIVLLACARRIGAAVFIQDTLKNDNATA